MLPGRGRDKTPHAKVLVAFCLGLRPAPHTNISNLSYCLLMGVPTVKVKRYVLSS
jgi:hypothetical protein